MLQKGPEKREIEIIASNYCRQSQAKTVAYELQRYIVNVRLMARKENNGKLAVGGIFSNSPQAYHFLTRDMYS